MKNSNTNFSELPLQILLAEAKSIVSGDNNLNEEKENLTHILDQVDFLLEKYDDMYSRFTEVFMAMGDFDFSKRLPFYDDRDNFINFIVSGINMINEELDSKAVKKDVFYRFYQSLSFEKTLLVVTKVDGFIYMANSGKFKLKGFNDTVLINQGINTLFDDFSIIENKLKEEGSVKYIPCDFKWNGEVYPASVDVSLSSINGKIDSLIYLIHLA